MRWVKIGGAMLVLVPVLLLAIGYQVYKQKPSEQPPEFDLFIAAVFFTSDNSSPWDRVSEDQKRPITWQLDPKQFERLDTIALTLTNTSGEKFYYMSWGTPFSRFRDDLIVYKHGVADTIPFGGHGCGTGVYLAPLYNRETMTRAIYHPLMFNPYTNYDLVLESDTFPNQFKTLYGDSVAIRFSQATYSTPWSNYPSQMIYSDYITVATDKILDHWRKGNFTHLPKMEPIIEEE